MTLSRKEIGEWGEKKAKLFLEKNSYKIVDTNFYTRSGEIDIIALKEEFIIFVEVKTRINLNYGLPQAGVDFKKKQKLKKVAKIYLNYNNFKYYNIRFDVIAIKIIKGKGYLKHFVNAFY